MHSLHPVPEGRQRCQETPDNGLGLWRRFEELVLEELLCRRPQLGFFVKALRTPGGGV